MNKIESSTKLTATSNQIVLGETTTTTISAPTPAAPRVITVDDALADCYVSIDTSGTMRITNGGSVNQILGAVDTTSAQWKAISSKTNIGNYSIGGGTPTVAAFQFTVSSGTPVYNIPLAGTGYNFMLCQL